MPKVIIKIVQSSLCKYNLLFKSNCLLFLGIIISFNLTPAFAQNNKIKINQDSLTQGLAIQGTSGGTIKVIEIAQTENTPTGYCDGFVNRQPNHIFNLDTYFEYLRLEVESSADTTMIIKSDSGVWCNDDSGSANPIIEGQWKPGDYQVWVGSYQADANHNYQIKITGN